MATHLIIGAGAVGSAVAEQSRAAGNRTVLATRSGTSRGTDHPVIALDASNLDAIRAALSEHTPDAVFACMHGSKYSKAVWAAELPPLEKTLLDAAHEAEAPVIFPESLYAFGAPGSAPFTESSEIRATCGKPGVRARLLTQRRVSPTTTISIAASDYFGPYDATSHVAQLIVRNLIEGKRPMALGAPTAPHSFTYVPDLAAAMLASAARAAELAPSGDRILFAPTTAPASMSAIAAGLASAAGQEPTRPRGIPAAMVKILAPVAADFRDLKDVLYQWTQPYTMDSSASEQILRLRPTDRETAFKATMREAQLRLTNNGAIK